MTDSQAQRGDDIVIAQQGSRAVTVPQLERDSTGQPTGERSYVEAKRNDWLIRTVDNIRVSAAAMSRTTGVDKALTASDAPEEPHRPSQLQQEASYNRPRQNPGREEIQR
jgi:hypothetical protein